MVLKLQLFSKIQRPVFFKDTLTCTNQTENDLNNMSRLDLSNACWRQLKLHILSDFSTQE